jgi:hypothetical protein
MNVLLLHDNQQNVSATYVAIYKEDEILEDALNFLKVCIIEYLIPFYSLLF